MESIKKVLENYPSSHETSYLPHYVVIGNESIHTDAVVGGLLGC